MSPYVLPIRPAQVAVWVLAAVCCLADQSPETELLAALVVGATSVRLAGRHFAGWALTWVRYRLLRHDDRRLGTDPLLVLAPDFRLRQHHDRAGNRFGVIGSGNGWTAVLRLTTEPDVRWLSGLLRHVCENEEIPLAGAQLVARSERGRRVHLVALRYRPADAPLAALSRGPGELGEHRALVRAALNLLGTLAEAGYPATILEAGELAAELRATLGVQGEPAAVSDGWRAWSAAGTTQACFTPRADLESAFHAGARQAAFTVASFSLRRTSRGRLREDVVLRVVEHRRAPRADDLDVVAVPLYGRHESAVRRTLPLACAR
ncbi:type VII secretion protein EccE [Amycolatopsis bartoniae]|nr:type VII secretion protein EccE [Amycolatopsis bartoniae]